MNSELNKRLTKIDQLLVNDHWYLNSDDQCWFFGEYTSGKRYDFSPGNGLIKNLKHGVEHKSTPRWRHKLQAMREVGLALAARVQASQFLQDCAFVPVPPSKARTDPLHDDRMLSILRMAAAKCTAKMDVREIVVQTSSTRCTHESESRLTPEELTAVYRINEEKASPAPSHIMVMDDLLTTGAHFRAMERVLRARYPLAVVMGLFICRVRRDAF